MNEFGTQVLGELLRLSSHACKGNVQVQIVDFLDNRKVEVQTSVLTYDPGVRRIAAQSLY